ncbi:MAG: hypothetical protein KKC24_16120 [Gammaproteobacteria bacterium]|jgi:hypothetical protein|uniref:hypothetical protein n=1 Tax=Pseudomonas sp. TaxID=306 RepID=UPI001D79D464|nr:hypothetical protein [Pseudomonas sp.]MBU0524220.1 hypothetical protein [Gammaproteobacteria bacterium]MDF9884084.1 hypothetical protein [Pseudomonas silensiensis]MBU0820370.1 hypothetical protein [Gammaproteobacteria bacterium]MBU0841564.1 hypothetical protein [Gammaproteobacteria bacterium]MBU1841188.1 hypothetical protein [Gammaproteobacteria bacterium]
MSTGLLEQRANYPHTQYEYGPAKGYADADGDGRKEIDCSGLLYRMLKDAGYSIPYLTTGQLNVDVTHFDVVPLVNVEPGDIALWINFHGHTGVVEDINSVRNAGNFFGSQTSSGPKSAKYGNQSGYWPMPEKFLRPKAIYRTGAQPAPAAAPTPAGPAPLMNFQYPFRKADGKQFTDAEEIYKVLEGETSGHYLLGSNKFWHGGIHITNSSAPQCVLNEPVRCMADGEVVAYRLNEDYLESTFGDNEKKLKYSNSFCLVRHEYKSAPNAEEGVNKGKQNKLKFYSLYMHLLPHARYPLAPEETPAKKVTMKVGDFNAYPTVPTPGVVSQADGKLVNGTQLEILETADSGELTYAKGKILSGSVKKGSAKTRGVGDAVWFAYLKNGEPYKNTANTQIWKEQLLPERLRPNYWQGKVKAKLVKRLPLYDAPTNPTNGQPAGSPKGTLQLNVGSVIEFDSKAVLNLTVGNQTLRMAACTLMSGALWGNGVVPPTFWACVENVLPNKYVSWETVAPSEFDSVVATSTGIKAGDPIGYLGQTENLTSEQGTSDSKFQVHVEIFTAEAEVIDFLKNLAGLKTGKQYLQLPTGTELKKVAPATGTTPLKLDHTVDLVKAPVIKVGTEDWYNVSVTDDGQPVSGLVKKAGAKIITQHDWEKLGFQIVEETNATADGFLDPEDMPQFFKDLFAKIDTNYDGQVDSAELANALKNAETRSRWSKLIAHHPTEWKDKADSAKWSKLDQLLDTSPKTLRHEKERISKYVFWDELTGKSAISSSLIWHFHPIALIDNFMSQSVYIDVERFVAMYAEQHASFQAESPALSAKSKDNLREIIKNINIYVDKNREMLTIYELSYMFATARHEAYNYTIAEYFSAAPEIGPVSYFDKYDPVLAASAAHRERAIGNGNTVQGDGFKYRGRGLVHLTWKNNYQKAKDYFGIDFVGSPEEAAGFKNSVPIMIWGMKEGIFTNQKLGTYVNNTTKDYQGARKVINGSDQKVLIASYATKFEAILRATSVAPETR